VVIKEEKATDSELCFYLDPKFRGKIFLRWPQKYARQEYIN
jgi:hypothetical protein